MDERSWRVDGLREDDVGCRKRETRRRVDAYLTRAHVGECRVVGGACFATYLIAGSNLDLAPGRRPTRPTPFSSASLAARKTSLGTFQSASLKLDTNDRETRSPHLDQISSPAFESTQPSMTTLLKRPIRIYQYRLCALWGLESLCRLIQN
ncbi:hypothetical protein IWX50DRAFT_141046 [Phyllosticta citricarpa]